MMDVARSWMDRPDYPIGAYLGAGLKDYVSQGPSEVKAFTTAHPPSSSQLTHSDALIRAMSMPSTAVATWTGRSSVPLPQSR